MTPCPQDQQAGFPLCVHGMPLIFPLSLKHILALSARWTGSATEPTAHAVSGGTGPCWSGGQPHANAHSEQTISSRALPIPSLQEVRSLGELPATGLGFGPLHCQGAPACGEFSVLPTCAHALRLTNSLCNAMALGDPQGAPPAGGTSG